jgi:hypothetical protein
MERITTQIEARSIFGKNFIGVEEILNINEQFPLNIPEEIPDINIPKDILIENKDTHILILSVSKFEDNNDVTILNLRNYFNNIRIECFPKFYNQDWYLKEEFTQTPLELGWHLLRKEVFESSRGVTPDELEVQYQLPSAKLCTYTFFVFFFCRGIILWEYDFIWCKDLDHNGDRIYVGKYTDLTGISNSGFSIHRHLKLRSYYASIDCV